MERNKQVTTAFATVFDDLVIDNELTGNEVYPIAGDLLTPEDAAIIFQKLRGVNKHWFCLNKADIVRDYLGEGEIHAGSLHVWSKGMKSNYGYDFHPPLEFHAWVAIGEGIIDVALPGVIERGLATSDKLGSILEGREPIILAGAPLHWLQYKSEIVRGY